MAKMQYKTMKWIEGSEKRVSRKGKRGREKG
jgi:hypothetical protein